MLRKLIDLIKSAFGRLAHFVLGPRGAAPAPHGPRPGPPRFDPEYPEERPVATSAVGGVRAGSGFQLGTFFDDPHRNVARMQRQTADAVLGAAGAPYLPARLLQLLKRHDAFHASDLFLRSLGLDYALLLESARDREYLRRATLILVEVDTLLRDSGLDDGPLYRLFAARASDEVIESRVERLRKVAAIVASMRARRVSFPEYRTEFLPQAEEATRRWETADDALISELHAALLEWEAAQEEYERLNSEIAELARLIYGRAPAAAAARLPPIIRTAERIRVAAESGKVSAADAVGELRAVLEELRKVYESIPRRGGGGGASGGRRAAGAGGTSEAQARLRTLGLNYPDDLNHDAVRRAFRNLAHLHHPDKAGGSKETFIELRDAYDWLMKYIDRKGAAHERKV